MSERTEVQNPLVRYATEIGWTIIAQNDALTLYGAAQAGRAGGVDDGRVRVKALL
jgi:hypothetical protein